MTHSLYSQDREQFIAFFDKFDAQQIKNAIVEHLQGNKEDVLEHCTEYSKQELKRFYGSKILNFYGCNKKGEPCKIVLKGDKEYYKKLN